MALADIRHEIVLTIAQTKEAQREARKALAHGSYFEKVEAAGELDFLRRQRSHLDLRLAELDQRIAEHRTLFTWFRQTWFNLMLQFERWIAHG